MNESDADTSLRIAAPVDTISADVKYRSYEMYAVFFEVLVVLADVTRVSRLQSP